MTPDHGTPGNGLLLFFRVDDFDLAPWRFKGHALSPVVSKRSHTTIRTLERRSFAPRSGRILRYDQSALGAKMRTICNADCSRSSHELGATEMDRPGDHWRSPDRTQGAYKHEAKEHDLPLVRQGRA